MITRPLVFFVCLAAVTETAVARLPEHNVTLNCTGRMTTQGNDGDRDWGIQTYIVSVGPKGKASASGGPWGGGNFCKDDPMYTYETDHHKLTITRNKGHLGMGQMTIDFLTGAFEFGGGGIDGGSHMSGNCVRQAAPASG